MESAPQLPPCSPISDSGESHQSGRPSWKSKLAPFMPKKQSKGKPAADHRKVQLELHNSVDDDLLVVLKQVVRTILENKEEEVTKGALYRVLRKFARCQVDLKSLELQLHRTNQELNQSQAQLVASQQAQARSVAFTHASAQCISSLQVAKLQQMMMDLEQIHTKQRAKYQQALTLAQQAEASARQSLAATTQERDQLLVELEQQRATTAVCEQVMQALQETLVEKDDCIRQQREEMERLEIQLEATQQGVTERDATIAELQEKVETLQSEVASVEEARAIGVVEPVQVASDDSGKAELKALDVPEPVERTVARFTEVRLEDGKDGGFMLSRFDELVQRRSEQTSDVLVAPSVDRAILQVDGSDDKPWRVDELRKRRDEQEEDMKMQLLRIGKSPAAGQATAQSPDRDSLRSAPSSPSDRDAATLKTHIAVQEALIKERDDTIEELQAQVKDLSTKLDATVALTASLAMRDLERTRSGDDATSRDIGNVDNAQLEELQRTLKHSEGKVAKLKQELSLSKRKLTNSEQKIRLLETFIMEDLQDAVVLGEVTESQRRKKTLDSFEESTRSILDESQMVALEKEALKSEVYELKSQLKIAHAMVSDLEKDRKLLRARVANIDPLGEIKERGEIEAKMYELSLELADVTVERDALLDALETTGKHKDDYMAKSTMNPPFEAETRAMTDASEGSIKVTSDRSTRLSFFSAQEHQVSPESSPHTLGRESVTREGITSLFAPLSLEDISQSEATKALEQRVAELESEKRAYAASIDDLKRQLSKSMPAHYAK